MRSDGTVGGGEVDGRTGTVRVGTLFQVYTGLVFCPGTHSSDYPTSRGLLSPVHGSMFLFFFTF